MVENNYSYQVISEVPDQNILDALLHLYAELFEDAKLDFFVDRVQTKENLIIILCYHENELIGFKLGYRYNDHTFYSWVGGVLPRFRKQGIAQKLMELQHSSAKKKGYQKARTKSMNRFKPMMILNLKNGFEIVKIYTNDSGQTKIIFEKSLA
ncbi:GNAT family N-acetyltransferase [Flavobacteriaceae bacterium S356]|uniref:GNAT family N-acetyltransferase n=1 Tax=Asprobacillus argus TaxID=3076534 RepID=A0ABU3LCT1_9FLAO|nr:GNAT family N-acetyltransferase [Flavobacteriaceae bacterium S356]